MIATMEREMPVTMMTEEPKTLPQMLEDSRPFWKHCTITSRHPSNGQLFDVHINNVGGAFFPDQPAWSERTETQMTIFSRQGRIIELQSMLHKGDKDLFHVQSDNLRQIRITPKTEEAKARISEFVEGIYGDIQ